MAKTTTCCLFLIEMLVGVVLLLSSMTTVVVVVDAWSPLPKAAVVQPQSDMSGDSSSQQQPIAAMATSSATIRELRMPGVVPQKDDDYVCAAFKVDEDEELYITKFRVEGTAERAHHMILSGCGDVPPEASNPSWNCGSHGTCRGHSSVLFAWALNAPGTVLPPQVGFRIGGKRSKVKYVVVQVHYAHKLAAGERDYSGMDLEVTSEPQKYLAGIFLLLSTPTIPPGEPKVHSDSMCPVEMTTPAKIFAARVHAHKLGTVITGYRHDGKTNQVEEVARGNPQWPQAFYATKKEIEIEKGDTLLVRCTYNSTAKTTFTHTGGTANDEMCNMYLMYYTDAEKGVAYESCGYLPGARETAWFPADSDEQLPPNPILDAYALHGHRNSNSNSNGNSKKKEPSSNSPATPLTAEQWAAKLLEEHDHDAHQQQQHHDHHTDGPSSSSSSSSSGGGGGGEPLSSDMDPSVIAQRHNNGNINPQMDTMTLNRVHYKQFIGGPPPPESSSSSIASDPQHQQQQQTNTNTNTRNHPSVSDDDDDGGDSAIGLVIRVEDSDATAPAADQATVSKQKETVVVLTLPVDNVSDFLLQQQQQQQPRQRQQQPNNPAIHPHLTAGGLSFRRANIRPPSASDPNHFNNNNYYYHQHHQRRPSPYPYPYPYYNQFDYYSPTLAQQFYHPQFYSAARLP